MVPPMVNPETAQARLHDTASRAGTRRGRQPAQSAESSTYAASDENRLRSVGGLSSASTIEQKPRFWPAREVPNSEGDVVSCPLGGDSLSGSEIGAPHGAAAIAAARQQGPHRVLRAPVPIEKVECGSGMAPVLRTLPVAPMRPRRRCRAERPWPRNACMVLVDVAVVDLFVAEALPRAGADCDANVRRDDRRGRSRGVGCVVHPSALLRRLGGLHPVEEDAVGDGAAEVAQSRSHGCDDESCGRSSRNSATARWMTSMGERSWPDPIPIQSFAGSSPRPSSAASGPAGVGRGEAPTPRSSVCLRPQSARAS